MSENIYEILIYFHEICLHVIFLIILKFLRKNVSQSSFASVCFTIPPVFKTSFSFCMGHDFYDFFPVYFQFIICSREYTLRAK